MFCGPTTGAAGTSHSLSYEAIDRSTFSSSLSTAISQARANNSHMPRRSGLRDAEEMFAALTSPAPSYQSKLSDSESRAACRNVLLPFVV
jgi:hypothetical protein